tara:strand:- start:91 stop:627 length:537 start_codon:yes stop_codon:yes gene_type:complete
MNDRYIVFDRDGTLIKHIPYLHKVEEVELFNDTIKSIKILKRNGFKFFLHTNQSGISRKYFSIDDVIKCNNKLITMIGLGNDLFEDICIAEDYPRKKNSYRKPSPKFGLEIIDKYKIKKENLFYVGDSVSDLQTGNNIGCHSYGVNTGLVDLNPSYDNRKKFDISKSLFEVVNKIIKE